jgi:hypothetical protein
MSHEELQNLIDRLAPPAQKGRRRRFNVMVTLSDSEHATLAALAAELHRPLAELVRGLALVAAAAIDNGEVGREATAGT